MDDAGAACEVSANRCGYPKIKRLRRKIGQKQRRRNIRFAFCR